MLKIEIFILALKIVLMVNAKCLLGRLMVLEFAILKMLDQAKDFEKVLFLVPLPSSVVEMEKNWRNKFVHWKMCTLVNNLNEPFSAARIVITTFENVRVLF